MRPGWRGALTLLAFVAGCASQTTPRATVTVLSFNIRYGSADDGPDRWELRRDLTLESVRAAGADVIGLQEALEFQVDEVAAALPGYGYVGVGRDDGVRAGEFVPVFYRSDRFREEDHGHFWYSDTPGVPGSTGWGNSITRMCTWVRLADRQTGKTFTVFNTHWDHQSQPSREASARLLRDRVGLGASEPVIVTGDFNVGPSNAAMQTLTGEMVTSPDRSRFRLVDSFFTLHPLTGDLGTFHAFRGTTTGDKIDAVLVGPGWTVVSAAIDRASYDGRFPSDHFAVRAVLAYDR